MSFFCYFRSRYFNKNVHFSRRTLVDDKQFDSGNTVPPTSACSHVSHSVSQTVVTRRYKVWEYEFACFNRLTHDGISSYRFPIAFGPWWYVFTRRMQKKKISHLQDID